MTVLPELGRQLRHCRGVLVDTNVLIDEATNDPMWADWSIQAISECAERTELVINPIIYAELSTSYLEIEVLDQALPEHVYQRAHLPWQAAFLAGKAFVAYKRRGGARIAPLPDFYIGAHAAIEHLAVLTRDARRFRSYFPSVEVLSPA